MTTGALLFMIISYTFVLSLTSWSFWRILRGRSASERRPEEADPGVWHP